MNMIIPTNLVCILFGPPSLLYPSISLFFILASVLIVPLKRNSSMLSIMFSLTLNFISMVQWYNNSMHIQDINPKLLACES